MGMHFIDDNLDAEYQAGRLGIEGAEPDVELWQSKLGWHWRTNLPDGREVGSIHTYPTEVAALAAAREAHQKEV